MLCSEQALGDLLTRKEEEWRALQAQRAQLQEAALRDTQSRLQEAQGRLRRLQEDFVYNLQVLEERDHELQCYDAAFAQARQQEEARQAEASELKIEAAKLRQALSREAQRVQELQQQQQLRLQEHRLELERIHSDKNGEINHHREQYENLKWKLERKLEELNGELAVQRQELMLEFESEMQKREHAFRLKAEDMSNAVLSHELKAKLLNRELEALKEAGAQAAECLQRAETVNAELERKLQSQAWELRDLEAMKDARIKDLEDELLSVKLTRKKEEEMFKRKQEELDHLARERDAVLAAVKDTHTEQLRVLEARVLELQAHCETLEGQLRRAKWTEADVAKEKDAVIDRLHEDLAALKAGWDIQIAQTSKEAVSKDLQIQTLQEQETKLKAQVARFQQDINRYKQQLSLAVERERSLERDQVQLGLDWQRRCDDVERDQIQKSEALIQGLTEARGQVAAKLQETEQALREQEVVLKAVALERDQAVAALHMHRLLPGQEAQMPPRQCEGEGSEEFPSSEIQRLQEQNTSLRNAISQMRKEMEALVNQVLPSAQPGESTEADVPSPQAVGSGAPPVSVLALEADVRNLKHKLKALEEQLDSPAPSKPSLDTADPHPSTHTSAETAGGPAQAYQAPTGLALRKLGDRVHLLNLLVMRLKKKVRQKPLELDAVQYKLPTEIDQVHLEVLELGKQVAELEKHLRPAQCREGEAYSRKQPRREGLADGRPRMGAENQEEFSGHPQPGAQPPPALSVPHLQRKLKEAARKILSLRLEKEQLIEMGNRLRAELGHSKEKLAPWPRFSLTEPQDLGETPEMPLDHGTPLGQLQPHMTAQRQHKISAVTTKSTRQKENMSPKPPQSKEVPKENGHHTQKSSSLASSSLQDTWRLLDLGSSPSGLPSQDGSTPEHSAPPAAPSPLEADRSPGKTQGGFAVQGTRMVAQLRAKPVRPAKPHLAKPKSRIRNYNLKA